MFQRLVEYRGLVVSLVRVQYRLRYRQSFAGIMWAILPPLATLGTAILVFHKVAGIGTGTVSYATFTMAALAPWTFFANSLALAVPSVAQAAPVVTRLPFPRAVLPFSLVGLSLLDFAVSGAIFLVFAVFTRTALPITGLWFPVLLLIEIAFTAGVALLGSALNVFARDVKLAVPLIVQLWLFITPVMYPLSSVPSGLRRWYQLNPMTGLVESFRSVLLFGKAPRSQDLVPAVVGAVLLLVVGWWYFAATERRFADVI